MPLRDGWQDSAKFGRVVISRRHQGIDENGFHNLRFVVRCFGKLSITTNDFQPFGLSLSKVKGVMKPLRS
jgi:hypothetical protein